MNDTTSPSHQNFPQWPGWQNPIADLIHIAREAKDPGSGSTLDASNQYVLDLINGDVPLPSDGDYLKDFAQNYVNVASLPRDKTDLANVTSTDTNKTNEDCSAVSAVQKAINGAVNEQAIEGQTNLLQQSSGILSASGAYRGYMSPADTIAALTGDNDPNSPMKVLEEIENSQKRLLAL